MDAACMLEISWKDFFFRNLEFFIELNRLNALHSFILAGVRPEQITARVVERVLSPARAFMLSWACRHMKRQKVRGLITHSWRTRTAFQNFRKAATDRLPPIPTILSANLAVAMAHVVKFICLLPVCGFCYRKPAHADRSPA
jgi:hypothetical protein